MGEEFEVSFVLLCIALRKLYGEFWVRPCRFDEEVGRHFNDFRGGMYGERHALVLRVGGKEVR